MKNMEKLYRKPPDLRFTIFELQGQFGKGDEE
jgi:hypothetical protein